MKLASQWNSLLALGFWIALFVSTGHCHPFTHSKGGDAGAHHGAPTDPTGLLKGNDHFAKKMKAVNASFVKESAVTQHPSFMFLGCSDSRVSEGNIFNTQPGVIFAGRNVAAQYIEEDDNENSVLLYAIHHLNVAHIIVMGHYGCGGVAAAISSTMNKKADAKDSIDRWIWPIRELYLNSKREEIVALRNTHKKRSTAPSPPDDPVYNAGYRALVEENVKANVDRIVKSKAAKGTHNPKVQIYGWVYDVATLDISDLEVTRTLG